MAETLLQQSQDMLLLWQLYQMNYYLERIQRNLGIINTVPNAQIITVIGGNLFSLASQYYGDQSQWVIIAKANNLKDPFLVGEHTIIIPPWNGVDTGGILQ
jgi:hypothetical protein